MDLTQGYFDISPEVWEGTAVFPGDTPFSREISLDFAAGDGLRLSSMKGTPHVGAHADAPNHYHPEGKGISDVPLAPYLGPCQVISVGLSRGERIKPVHIQATQIRAARVLFKTGSFPDPDHWNGNFNSLSAELLEALAAQGVVLVGIDTPSIDPAEDKVLESHQAIFRLGMRNLEGLCLETVPDGVYTLVALPLRIRGADASPVRAILVRGVTS